MLDHTGIVGQEKRQVGSTAFFKGMITTKSQLT